MNFGKITSIESYTDEFVCFVKVTTDEGLEGWGQTSTYNADITAQVLHRQVAPWVLGQSADDIGFLINRVTQEVTAAEPMQVLILRFGICKVKRKTNRLLNY
ncbi:MAG: hypothetical protein RLZ15_823 [Actinomycetota bacterium]